MTQIEMFSLGGRGQAAPPQQVQIQERVPRGASRDSAQHGAARTFDPPAAKAAAARMRPGGVVAAILDALGAYPAGLTIAELAEATGRKEVSVSPRIATLRRAFLIRQSGTRKNASGMTAAVWVKA